MRTSVLATVVSTAVGALSLALGSAPAAADHWSFTIPGGLHVESDSGDRLVLRINEDGRKLKVDSHGHFELNDDETDVVELEAGGSMRVEERRHGFTKYKLELRGLPDGSIERTYRHGDVREFDAEGREWFASALALMLRNTSFDAENHMERVLRRSGVDGALDEIEHMDSDHAKRKCYALLLEKAPDDPELPRRIAASAGREIDSGHELAKLAAHLVETHFEDEELLDTCIAFTPHIGSDHERRRVLMAIAKQRELSPALVEAIAKSAEDMGSDHERAEVLIALADTQTLHPSASDAFFTAVDGIGSDHETRRVLVSTLARHGAQPHIAAGAARCAAGIGSDHECAEVLRTIVGTAALGPMLSPEFFTAARGLGSDQERGNVMLAVLRQGSLEPEVLRDLLSCTEKIGSDHRKAEVLSEVVDTQTLDADLRRQFEDVARGIGSDRSREHVLELLHEREL